MVMNKKLVVSRSIGFPRWCSAEFVPENCMQRPWVARKMCQMRYLDPRGTLRIELKGMPVESTIRTYHLFLVPKETHE